MRQTYRSYFYMPAAQPPDLPRLCQIIQGYDFNYLGSSEFSLVLDEQNFSWMAEQQLFADTLDELLALGEDALLINQMWEGQHGCGFYLSFHRYQPGWIMVFECSEDDFERFELHFNQSQQHENNQYEILALLTDLYHALHASNILICSHFGLPDEEYLQLADQQFVGIEDYSDLISGAAGFDDAFNQHLLQDGFDVFNSKGLDFYIRWLFMTF